MEAHGGGEVGSPPESSRRGCRVVSRKEPPANPALCPARRGNAGTFPHWAGGREGGKEEGTECLASDPQGISGSLRGWRGGCGDLEPLKRNANGWRKDGPGPWLLSPVPAIGIIDGGYGPTRGPAVKTT